MNKNFSKINKILQKILNEYHLSDEIEIEKIFRQWNSIVNSTIAKNVKPVNYSEGTLILEAVDKHWKEEILKQKKLLIDQINNSLNQLKIKDLIIR